MFQYNRKIQVFYIGQYRILGVNIVVHNPTDKYDDS